MSFELCSCLIPYANALWELEVVDFNMGLKTHTKFHRIEMCCIKRTFVFTLLGKFLCLSLSLVTQASTCCLCGSRVIWRCYQDFRDTSLYSNKLNPERICDMILKKGLDTLRSLTKSYTRSKWQVATQHCHKTMIQVNHRVCGKCLNNIDFGKTFIVIMFWKPYLNNGWIGFRWEQS